MYKIPIFMTTYQAENISQKLLPVLIRCGFTCRIAKYGANQMYRGGTICIYSPRFIRKYHPKGSCLSTYSEDRIDALLARLLRRKKFSQSKEMFPIEPIDFKVHCNHSLHKISISDTGRMRLHNHDMKHLEDDMAMSCLAGDERLPRCLSLYHAWRIHDTSKYNEKFTPSMFTSYRFAIYKRRLRRRLKARMDERIDPLTVGFLDRWKQRLNKYWTSKTRFLSFKTFLQSPNEIVVLVNTYDQKEIQTKIIRSKNESDKQ